MILLLFLFALALGAVIPSDDQSVKLQRGNCPQFWFSFNGRCYKYIATTMTWAIAEFYCVSQGAHLVSIHSADEQNFVNSLISSFDYSAKPIWIGLNDLFHEGTFTWSDGSEVNFDFWNTGEPDDYGSRENCGQSSGPSFKWNDYSCTSSCPAVCAFSLTPEKTAR
ncbi:echinoidin-like [Acanthochromis polyacanthus]|nr:echinoidin-like [Acanthochromis polyacanthus]XP_051812112.1 echinoidin-like [Acanthochromis polyacanthus]